MRDALWLLAAIPVIAFATYALLAIYGYILAERAIVLYVQATHADELLGVDVGNRIAAKADRLANRSRRIARILRVPMPEDDDA